jgi:hypothetical protein
MKMRAILLITLVALSGCAFGPPDPYQMQSLSEQIQWQQEQLRETQQAMVPFHLYCYEAGDVEVCR